MVRFLAKLVEKLTRLVSFSGRVQESLPRFLTRLDGFSPGQYLKFDIFWLKWTYLRKFFYKFLLPSSALVPASAWAEWFQFQIIQADRPADRPTTIRNSTFQPEFSFDFKSKVVRLNGQTLEMTSDLNPISQGGHLTLFQPNSYLDEYLPILI